jgi:hypothetical protein
MTPPDENPFDRLFEDSSREAQPPTRDPWEEFAIEKVRAQLVDDEFYFDDQNRAFTAWAIGSAIAFGVSFAQAVTASEQASLWQVFFISSAAIATLVCTVLRIYGAVLSKRNLRRQKWLDRHGLKYL